MLKTLSCESRFSSSLWKKTFPMKIFTNNVVKWIWLISFAVGKSVFIYLFEESREICHKTEKTSERNLSISRICNERSLRENCFPGKMKTQRNFSLDSPDHKNGGKTRFCQLKIAFHNLVAFSLLIELTSFCFSIVRRIYFQNERSSFLQESRTREKAKLWVAAKEKCRACESVASKTSRRGRGEKMRNKLSFD